MDEKIKRFWNRTTNQNFRSKGKEAVRLKWAISYCLKNEGKSYPEIGRLMDMDHSTIIHSVKMAEKNLDILKDEIYKVSCFLENPDSRFIIMNNEKIPFYIPPKTRLRIFEKRGYKCQLCGFDDIVEIHHISGRGAGHGEENLMLVCPTCHKKIHLGMVVFKERIIEEPFPGLGC